MAVRHDSDKMALGGSDCPFRRESTMVVGRDVLEGKRDRGKVSGEVGRGFVIKEEMRERVREGGEKGDDRFEARNIRKRGAVFKGGVRRMYPWCTTTKMYSCPSYDRTGNRPVRSADDHAVLAMVKE